MPLAAPTSSAAFNHGTPATALPPQRPAPTPAMVVRRPRPTPEALPLLRAPGVPPTKGRAVTGSQTTGDGSSASSSWSSPLLASGLVPASGAVATSAARTAPRASASTPHNPPSPPLAVRPSTSAPPAQALLRRLATAPTLLAPACSCPTRPPHSRRSPRRSGLSGTGHSMLVSVCSASASAFDSTHRETVEERMPGGHKMDLHYTTILTAFTIKRRSPDSDRQRRGGDQHREASPLRRASDNTSTLPPTYYLKPLTHDGTFPVRRTHTQGIFSYLSPTYLPTRMDQPAPSSLPYT